VYNDHFKNLKEILSAYFLSFEPYRLYRQYLKILPTREKNVSIKKQDSNVNINITLQCIHITTVAMENQ
jgi:hypothetical protein